MKKIFTTKPILVTLDLDKNMRIEVDVLDYAIEGMLFIECEDRIWRPVAYLFKLLNNIEWNYEIYHKEMLAVIRRLEA